MSTLSNLMVQLQDYELLQALADWRWLVGQQVKPRHVTAGGDVVLVEPTGRILLLDTGAGDVLQLAETAAAFEEALDNPENVSDWYSASIVELLRRRGITLEQGQCFGYKILPVFKEGSYAVENRIALDAREHLIFTADVHRQLRELPDGSKVRLDFES